MNQPIDRAKFLMSYSNKMTLNENVHKFEQSSLPVITDWLSPDEKLIIFFDELYDIENKVKIGNIWENFDNFKYFLKHSFEVSTNIPQEIKESMLNKLNKSLLTESKRDYSNLKPLFKTILTERTWAEWGTETAKDFGDWVWNRGKEAVTGVTSFAKTSFEGAKKLLGNISRGEWTEAVELLKQGAKYTIRRLRDALYHPVGMLLDLVLVLTGVGKLPQAVLWAMVVALDIYEILNPNDVEEPKPFWLQLLELGFDILGLVLAGGVATAAKQLFKGTTYGFEAFVKFISGNSAAKKTIQEMAEAAAKTPSLLSKAADSLAKVFPMFEKFIRGILGSVEFVISKIVQGLKLLLQPKVVLGSGLFLGTYYTFEKLLEGGFDLLSKSINPTEPQGVMASASPNFGSQLMTGQADYEV